MYCAQQVGICHWLLCRENFLTKDDCSVAGGTGRPRSGGALPLGVTVFANATINKKHHNTASHHECKNTRHRDSAPTPHTAER